jgi:hypothetical protein
MNEIGSAIVISAITASLLAVFAGRSSPSVLTPETAPGTPSGRVEA